MYENSDESAIALVHDLVKIPSVSRDERAAVEFLVGWLSENNFEAEIDDAGNAVGIREKPNANNEITHTICLLGHIDTVPGEIPVRIEAGILHGRGSVDAKGSLASFVASAARVKIPVGMRLIVVGAVEEECATSKGARFVATRFRPDECLIGEPSGVDSITLGYKGRLLIDFESEQPVSHTAGSQDSVGDIAVDWWQRIKTYCQSFNADRPQLFEQLLPYLRSMHTDSDGLTDRAVVKASVRLPEHFDLEEFRDVIEKQSDARIKLYGHEPAHRCDRQNNLVRRLSASIMTAGHRRRFKHKTGTSDMNVVAPIWQCPTIAYGPGDSSLDHTPVEHLPLDEYLAAIRILTDCLQRPVG